MESPGFFCANQAIPEKANGYDKAYKPNMVCLEADEFNRIIEEISARDSALNRFKYKK